MTEQEARDLCRRRQAEQPGLRWVAERGGTDGEWVVAKLPGAGAQRIDPRTVESHKGEPGEVRDDPRPAIVRNIPPYGPGF
jgi:hypothetical protein